ncbi:MAG: hypothetical protein ACR2PL_11995 [Dehalococcoidia bacterium]
MVAPRRIVPVLSPEEHASMQAIAHRAHLTYHAGKLLTAVEVYTIFWGTAWQQPEQSGLIPRLNQFFDTILTSSLIDLLHEYNVPGQMIGHGKRIGTTTLASEPGQLQAGGSREVTDQAVQQALQMWIANGTVPQPTANTLYFVYLPPRVTSLLDNVGSCQPGGFCGYHHDINGSIFYAVEPFITCAGCEFGSGIFDSLTKVSSHELCEAITDPAGTGWFDDMTGGNEIGDICNSTVQKLGQYTIQAEWSNHAKRCVVAPPPGRQMAAR